MTSSIFEGDDNHPRDNIKETTDRQAEIENLWAVKCQENIKFPSSYRSEFPATVAHQKKPASCYNGAKFTQISYT